MNHHGLKKSLKITDTIIKSDNNKFRGNEHWMLGAGSCFASILQKERARPVGQVSSARREPRVRTKSCTDAHTAATTLTKIQSTEYIGEMPDIYNATHTHSAKEPSTSGEEELV